MFLRFALLLLPLPLGPGAGGGGGVLPGALALLLHFFRSVLDLLVELFYLLFLSHNLPIFRLIFLLLGPGFLLYLTLRGLVVFRAS